MNNQILQRFREYIQPLQFNAISIKLMSPEKIRSISYGEVKKIETINYRTLKPEKDGLFCAKIFGPVKDWECNCGKYKRMKHRGITCEKCNVEVIQSKVRRERMGHIELVSPVCHIWYLKGIPSYLSLILDISVKDIEKVVYFDSYIIINKGNSPYEEKTLINNLTYDNYFYDHPEDTAFKAGIGAEGIKQLLEKINFEFEITNLKELYEETTSVALKLKIIKRIKALTGLEQSNLRPEWMILVVLPVLPPDLRPLVPLEGGRFASSDLNELYRRVLNRNLRLKRLLEIDAPNVIIRNEKRMLQESVDALIDNGKRGFPVRSSNKLPLKSLSEMLRGKQGRFRQNLLGKRVDYSGRSVIVVDPQLKMNQCGLPKLMALELFKPYIFAELLKCELAANLKIAKKMVENQTTEVWDVLDNIVRDKVILLNRAPTLHRLGIQGFYPILVDGKAIKIHPLVCAAFNADFDGDQMAVHIPLSDRAQEESKNLILSTKNLLASSNGRPICTPSQEMIIGIYYATKMQKNCVNENITFSSPEEVNLAFNCGQIKLHTIINLFVNNKIVTTTVGRTLLYRIFPNDFNFDLVNKILKKKDISLLLETIYYKYSETETVTFLDKLKEFGFKFATISGISFVITDLIEPKKSKSIIENTEKKVLEIENMYREGAITNGERRSKIISFWGNSTFAIAKEMYKEFEDSDNEAYLNNDSKSNFNPIFMSIDSGARGSRDQVKQLVGMRGLMAKPSGEVIETPVKSNFKRGLSVFEYFISTHGARKGQADTALKTANSGYLTRRLVDVAQDIVVVIQDCKTFGFIEVENLKESGTIIHNIIDRIYGRVLAEDLKDEITQKILFKKDSLITKYDLPILEKAYFRKASIRSVLTCKSKRGVCAKCYGMDLSKGKLVEPGVAVGVIAAQSIGEPGTQLTMRTFHIGGIASVEKQTSFVSNFNGVIKFKNLEFVTDKTGKKLVVSRKGSIFVYSEDGKELQEIETQYGSILFVEEEQKITKDAEILQFDPNNDLIICEQEGIINYIDLIKSVTFEDKKDEEHSDGFKYINYKSDQYQPAITINFRRSEESKVDEIIQYYLPVGSYLYVANKSKVQVGDILIKIPKEASKVKDITGGLPRISEIFEARFSKDAAIISDIDGKVVFEGNYRNFVKISVVSSEIETSYEYLIPKSQQIIVSEGEQVKAGDLLTTGTPLLNDILRVLGPDALQVYIVNQIQEIYRLQGVNINDIHIEIIVKQMLSKVRIIDSGDTDFLIGDRVNKIQFQEVNAELRKQGKKPAIAKPMLMGITMASLITDSVFSAASFQETTRILTEAAVTGQIDYLYGLKENIIIGKLIPAGTGIKSFRDKYINLYSEEVAKKEF